MLLTTLLRQLANNPQAFDRFAELDDVVSTGANDNYGEINQILCKRSLESNTLAFPSVAKWFARCPINEVKSNHALLFAQISLTRLETDGEDPDVLLRVLPLLEQVLEFKGFEDFSLVLTRLAQLEVDNSQAWFRIVQLLVQHSHCALRDAGRDVDKFLTSPNWQQDELLCLEVVRFTLDNPIMYMLVTKHSANREAVLRAACEGKGQLLAKLLVEKWCLQPDADLLAVLQQVCKVNALSSLVLTRTKIAPFDVQIKVLNWLMECGSIPSLLYMLHEVAMTWIMVPHGWIVMTLDREEDLGPERVAWLCWMLGKQSQQNDDGVQACHVLEKLVARRKLTPYETSAVVGALSRLRCRKLAHAMLVNLS